MKNIAIVLSGCGVYDGAEIHEATLTMLAIDKAGAKYQCFAPNINQHHTINHITGDDMNETRNVLIESSRIARGDIKDLAQYNPDNYDAIIFPGGFGVAKNLCSFAFEGSDCVVNNDVDNAITNTHAAGKPIGALCISPALIARVIDGIDVTIGSNADTSAALEEMGAVHKTTTHGEITLDIKNKIVTTPCYMLDATISQIANGAENLVNAVLKI